MIDCTKCSYYASYKGGFAEHMKSHHLSESLPMHKGSAIRKPNQCNIATIASMPRFVTRT